MSGTSASTGPHDHGQLRKRDDVALLGRPYLTDYEDDLQRVWETERPFELHLPTAIISGRADVILDTDGGQIRSLAIVDYKTPTDPAAADDYALQLAICADAGLREGLRGNPAIEDLSPQNSVSARSARRYGVRSIGLWCFCGSMARDNGRQVAGMSRHGAFTVLLLTGLLMLSACSSGKPAIHIAGSVASVVHIGPYTQEFSSPPPANPAQASVVEGFREGQVLWNKSENAWHLVPPVRSYVTGHALADLIAAVNAGKARNLVPGGTDRFFMTRVTQITGHNATVATCDDGSKFEEVNPRTGKVDASFLPSPQQEYLFETWHMVQLSGHWAITALSLATLPAPRAEPCQPGIAGTGPTRPPDVPVLLRDMSAALHAATSVHLGGTDQDGGKTLGVNLGMIRSGQISGQISEDGAVLTMLATQGHAYVKLSAAFLKFSQLPASACSLFCGKFLELTAVQSQALLNGLNMTSFIASLTHSVTPAHAVSYQGTVSVGGTPAWLLVSHGTSVFVAARGKPYILRVVAPQSAEGTLNLSQWNAVPIPGPPPASQVVNLSQLTG